MPLLVHLFVVCTASDSVLFEVIDSIAALSAKNWRHEMNPIVKIPNEKDLTSNLSLV